MASDRTYLEWVLGQLSELEDISYRPMMGEYILYYKGKVIGGIYDNRLLLKPVRCPEIDLSAAVLDVPYQGAKPMLLVKNPEDKTYLTQLVEAIYPHLPAPKPRKRK